MTIYRGPGGTGSASSEVDTTEFHEFLVQAQAAKVAAEAARDAALAAETNAETAETNAELAETNAELAETNASASASAAASSASAAATSASSAASSASSAAASASSIDPANLVHISGTETITGVKTFSNTIVGSVSGNAGTVTNGVVTTGSYANPPWLTSLAWSKVTSTPTTIAGYGITNAYTKTEVDAADSLKLNAANPSYTGTLTGGIGVVNLGAGQFYKDASGNVGIGTTAPSQKLDVLAPLAVINVSSSTGTNYVKTQINNAGGSFQFAIENSIGSNFGAPAYARILWNDGAYPTVFYTNSTERARIDSSGQFKTMVTGGSAVMDAYACRAWVNFNGTSGAIRSSGNVSSVTRNGVGDYTVNFATAMPDANYATSGIVQNAAGGALAGLQIHQSVAPINTSVRVESIIVTTNGRYDAPQISVSINR